MIRTATTHPGGLISDLGLVNEWRPRRIAIAGVRFNSGGDGTQQQAAADDKGTIAGEGNDDAAAAAAAAAGEKTGDEGKKTPEEEAAAAAAKAEQDGKGKAGAGDSKPKAPDSYTLTASDEAKAALGDAMTFLTEDVTAIAKANGWTAEEAQTEFDNRLELAADRLEAQRSAWRKQVEADPDYGGDHLEETTKLARKAVDALRPKGHPRRAAFLQLLNGGGIGNHIEVVSALADLGRLMGEDTTIPGKGAAAEEGRKSTADVLFPSSAKK